MSRREFKTRKDLHLLRKLWHVGFGLGFAIAYQTFASREGMIRFLAIMSGAYLLIEFVRFRLPKVNRFGVNVMRSIIREGEDRRMHGGVAYALSCLFAAAIFSKPVAILSFLYLALGDPCASFFGVLLGKHGPRFSNGKSFVGFAAAALVCFVVTVIELEHFQLAGALPAGKVFSVALVGGLAAATAEVLSLGLDDNYTVPILSGLALWGIL